jgi:hypothetical protein
VAIDFHALTGSPNWLSLKAWPLAVRSLSLLLVGLLFVACSPGTQDAGPPPIRKDTLSHHTDGTPKEVTVRRGDSVLERRTYRSTGMLSKVVRKDSVQEYFDLHDPDSAAVLRDYLLGRWRNLSADTTRDQASVFYIFEKDQLTFENPARAPLESLGVTYEDDRTLRTSEGMSVKAEISSFDTVRVTGYTLLRVAPPDSL